ncbi:hypothetical protein [Lysinibacillus xylanilyticus]|uniref:hypothetical protein n=1 Tax=Lysinibacillus xylanilyticus TaxID=582475 RepID=UPI003D033B8A
MTNNPKGPNILELVFEECNGEAIAFQKNLILSYEKKKKLSTLIEKIDNDDFETTKEKGDALETLTRETLKMLMLFDALPNLHTSTNEIDFLCKLSKSGNIALSKGYINFHKEFLIECKNYNEKVDVTYVGKFAALLINHGMKFGIMVSKEGITGANTKWSYAYGWTKKLYLKCNVLIISLTLDDFRLMLEKSFFEIIEEKKLDIINDTDINSYLSKHPAMDNSPSE